MALFVVVLVVVAVVAFALGAWVSPQVVAERCDRIKGYSIRYSKQSGFPSTVTHVRCILSRHHRGPHCVKLNEGQSHQRLDWFEDEEEKEGTESASAVESGNDQAPAG